MLFSHLACGLASAASVVASPMLQVLEHRYATPEPDRWHHLPDGDEGASLFPRGRLEERDISKTWNISKRWQNKMLFQGQVFAMPSKDATHDGNTGVQRTVILTLTCVDCWTKGEIGFGLTMGNLTDGADDNDDDDNDDLSLGDKIKNEFKDVADDISNLKNYFNPVLRLDLSNVEIYAHLKTTISGALIYQWRLWTLTPPGWAVFQKQGWLKVGPSASLDLIFVAASSINIETGFHMKLPPDAFLELDVRDGNIVNQLVNGTITKTLPVKITLGQSVLIADLRIAVGIDVNPGRSIDPVDTGRTDASPKKRDTSLSRPQQRDLDRRFLFSGNRNTQARVGMGFGIQAFANLIEWTANVTTDIRGHTSCALMLSHELNSNVGVAAYAAALVDRKMIGYLPRTSWKFLQSKPTATCLIPNPRRTPGAGLPLAANATTTAPPSGPTGNQVVVEHVLTTCASPIVNCPDSLLGTVTVTNTLDAAVASDLPQPAGNSSSGAAPSSSGSLGDKIKDKAHRAKDKVKGIFERSDEELEWLEVEWEDLPSPVLLQLPDSIAQATQDSSSTAAPTSTAANITPPTITPTTLP